MPDIFDLSSVSKFVETHSLNRILVLDTSVVMDVPDAEQWTVEAGGQTLFVLSDTIIQELQVHQRQEKAKDGSREKAVQSVDALAALFSRGKIAEGIPVNGGWVVSVPSPRKDDIQPELDQLCDMVNAFGRPDTKLLLLTRDCHRRFQYSPATMVTKDRSLFLLAETQGIPSCLWTGFPISGLRESAAMAKPVDWNGVLEQINERIRQNAIPVEVTLDGQSVAPDWISTISVSRSFAVAEGHGIMRRSQRHWPFRWTVCYYPILPSSEDQVDDKDGVVDFPTVHLDFSGEDNFEQDLFDAIADYLLECALPKVEEGMPTFQSPEVLLETIARIFHLNESVNDPRSPEEKRAAFAQELAEEGGLVEFWSECVAHTPGYVDKLLVALANCWRPGQTYVFSILPREAQ